MFGLNPNLTLAELFQRKMLSIGRQVELPSMGDSGLLAHSLTAEDCAVIISYSGNSIHHGPLSVLSALEERRVPVIALTSVGDNLLRQRADYTLSISSYERLYSKISTFATENSILYILNVLFSCCFARPRPTRSLPTPSRSRRPVWQPRPRSRRSAPQQSPRRRLLLKPQPARLPRLPLPRPLKLRPRRVQRLPLPNKQLAIR